MTAQSIQFRYALALIVLLNVASTASANKIGWLDDVVQKAVRSSDASFSSTSRGTRRWLDHAADEGLSAFAKQSDELAGAARSADELTEAVSEARFIRLVDADPEALRVFRALEPAERRLVLRVGEAAQRIALRYPDNAETMIRKLGVEGLTAVRVYGDDVAEVIAKEGPEAINVLRKSGRSGWKFYTETVLRHKKKLAAAGVLALFVTNPEQFIDSAGQITEYAARKFSEAGVNLAGVVGSSFANGISQGIDDAIGFSNPLLKWSAITACGVVALFALAIFFGAPVRLLLSPILLPFRLLGRGLRATVRT